ncbi:Prolyl oligopeptidase family protein [Catalinimonas alkaloidigena]|uniref:Prolyl oligopeptidase family protein n=1 Tax=Catalinimonas alkaloidigena TaxID=1075417 RepID=A0A1G9K1N2_9BACT|nr:prolyl oligopeptidase family serine peptidase [Catalinimonas alkaloidigena]SDL43235.1 Prolyl oligopeptidase family protein [Catalinimonas alkaloidigena]
MPQKLRFLFLVIVWSLSPWAMAQQTHTFTEGLTIGPCHHYGREALYTDQLAYLLYRNELPTPTEGQALTPGDTLTWQAVQVDTSGAFRRGVQSNGYLYLTYEAAEAGPAILHIQGHNMVYVNGEPRAGDMYRMGWMYMPVQLKKGKNELFVRTLPYRWQSITAELRFPEKPVHLATDDPTLPSLVPGQDNRSLWGAVVVVNTTEKPLTNLSMRSRVEGKELTTELPTVPPLTTRKVGFWLDGSAVTQEGNYTGQLALLQKGKVLDEKEIPLEAPAPGRQYSATFVSDIDGSVQYYAVAPQQNSDGEAPALFLSVHGAGVEAIGQARAYRPKDWGVLVTPTNRRPRGFNWEDWGRLDALEVLDIAKKRFQPDPQRIYLTGHSMGGHGTWYLGATFPDRWAAIAPCAGYPTLRTYGSHDGQIPEAGGTPMESLLLRASNPSNTIALASNYKPLGVYVLHGDADPVVSVDYARQMRQLLGTFHPDLSYYEYPGGSHWYGDESVDWKPLFDFFKWHTIPVDSAAHDLDFMTANPAISASMHWATIQQQQQPLEYSRIQLHRDKAARTIKGTTENVAVLTLDLNDFQPGETVTIQLDSLSAVAVPIEAPDAKVHLVKGDAWTVTELPEATQKGPHRSGTFKEPFQDRMVFVYATGGSADERAWAYQKARYDAETWYFRGNGAVDLVADRDFNPKKFADRGVVLYGNSSTNKAWSKLLADCPIQVQKGKLQLGEEELTGDDLGAYFAWPRKDSPTASVAVIAGTGLRGMRATDANQYFSGGSGFPDFMIFSLDMLKEGSSGVKRAGFFGNDWTLGSGEVVK